LTLPAVFIILFFVMSDLDQFSKIGFEEIFEGDDAARAEFEAWHENCESEAIAAQDAKMSEHPFGDFKKLHQ